MSNSNSLNVPPDFSNWSCPLPLVGYPTIVMGHGGGGKLGNELVEHLFLPAFRNPALENLGDAAVLRVGDRCVIGRGSHIVAHQSIVIGDDVYTGPYVYITDQNHGYADPDIPIGRQWPSNTAVSIGPGSWLGAGAIVLPGACIGRNVVVAAGSVVRGQVPDRCVVAGVPARVVREYSSTAGWARPSPVPGERA